MKTIEYILDIYLAMAIAGQV